MKKCFQDRQRYFAQLLEKLIKMLCWWKKIGYSENRSYFFTAGCRLFFFFGSWWLLHWFLVCTSSMSDFYSIKSELFLLSIVVFTLWSLICGSKIISCSLTSLKSYETFLGRKTCYHKLIFTTPAQTANIWSCGVKNVYSSLSAHHKWFFLAYVGKTCSCSF